MGCSLGLSEWANTSSTKKAPKLSRAKAGHALHSGGPVKSGQRSAMHRISKLLIDI